MITKIKEFIAKQAAKLMAPGFIKSIAKNITVLLAGFLAGILPNDIAVGEALTALLDGLEQLIIALGKVFLFSL